MTVEEQKEQTEQIEVATTVNIVEQQTTEKTQSETEVHHPTTDEIEDYEESQRRFHELWELKREKVNFEFNHITFFFLYL